MQITKEAFYQLSSIYFTFFEDSNLIIQSPIIKKEAEAILKVLNIRINRTYPDNIFATFNREILYKSHIKYLNNKTVPTDLSRLDLESIEVILNKENYLFSTPYMSPLFDSIGWILSNKNGSWKIYFIGSPTYDPWNILKFEQKDLQEEINISLDKKEIEWYKGNNWLDGISEEDLKNPNWKEIKE